MEFLYMLEKIRTPFLDGLMRVVTELGGEMIYMVVAIVVFWCVSKNLGYYILTTGFVGTIANQFMKLAFRVPRPWVLDERFTIVESARAGAAGYSFPSGHTQNVFSTFGSIGRWTKSKPVRILCAAAVVLVAFSRMYLGVHTPKDVCLAFIMGLVLVFVLYPIFRDIDKHPKRMYAAFGVMLGVTLAYLCYTELWPFPQDIDVGNLEAGKKAGYSLLGASAGMLLAFMIDTRYVHFDVRAGMLAQVVKVVVGLAVTLLIKEGLKAPLALLPIGTGAATAARYFVVIVFAAGVWPMTFRWFSSWKKKT